MSRWLRRGFGQTTTATDNNSNNDYTTSTSAGFEPPRNSSSSNRRDNMPAAAAPFGSPPAYGSSPGAGNMDVDHHQQQRKYHSHSSSSYHNNNTKGYPADPSGRGGRTTGRSTREDPEEGYRSRSGRSSSNHGSTSSRQRYSPQQQPPPPASSGAIGYQSRGGGAAPASSQHFSPPPPGSSSFRATPPSSQTTTENGQPTYPPPAVTSESPPPSEQAQRRPAYLLHRDLVIGKGSYGQVCIASRGESEGHSSSGRSGKRKKFACKCVMLRNDPKYIAKLQEEVNVLRELRGHDNVIRLYDVFCVDNELFIITELGRGGDLFHLLTTHPKHGVTEAYAAKTVAEMLSSVAFLHSRSICHRDLKLENWVLESGKDVWSPLKLIDFGLSTHFQPGQRLSRVVGSSYYVAPEVLKKSYTEACDLWSLGVIVYMLLSGAPPFYGKNDEAIKASIVQGEYTFPHELFRDVSDEAMAFVSTLLSYNIEYRYTAEQALTHPWLAANCDPGLLQKAKDGARGSGIPMDNRPEPMQI